MRMKKYTPSSAAKRLAQRLAGVFAQFEQEMRSERIMQGILKRKERLNQYVKQP